ncbi:MAG: YabP/YqfC family sporulation protein [Oscillospiraceae bacterium]|nr:YabP/YqfC family sporulation protein [Oscillospiraceae bacterium]
MERDVIWKKFRNNSGSGAGPQPLVELFGERRVLLEHHQGVLAYGKQEVRIKVRYGQVRVWGTGLCLSRMTAEQLVVCGHIGGVELLRNGGGGCE